MIRNILLLFVISVVSCNDAKEEKKAEEQPATETAQYAKMDLQKIKWIEGKWKGLYNGKPFYEIYTFVNDSTLESLSYHWDGKDSSKTSRSYVHYKNGFYYLGDKDNYKVVSITENEIKMLPNVEANNDVLWKRRDSTGWDAILKAPSQTNTYNMERFDPFRK
jgi:hypothetical protein